MSLHLTEFKTQDFITPTPYSIPPTSTNLEDTFSVYSNPLFDNKEDFPPVVQKLVIKTPLDLQKGLLPLLHILIPLRIHHHLLNIHLHHHPLSHPILLL